MITTKIPVSESAQSALGSSSHLEEQVTETSELLDRLKSQVRQRKKKAIQRFRRMQSSMSQMRDTNNWERLHRDASSLRSDKENIGYYQNDLDGYIARYDEAVAGVDVIELSLLNANYVTTCIGESVMISIFTPYGATINLDCFGDMGASLEVTSKQIQPYYAASDGLTKINLNTMVIDAAEDGMTIQQRVDQCVKICRDCYSQSIQGVDDEDELVTF